MGPRCLERQYDLRVLVSFVVCYLAVGSLCCFCSIPGIIAWKLCVSARTVILDKSKSRWYFYFAGVRTHPLSKRTKDRGSDQWQCVCPRLEAKFGRWIWLRCGDTLGCNSRELLHSTAVVRTAVRTYARETDGRHVSCLVLPISTEHPHSRTPGDTPMRRPFVTYDFGNP